MKIHKLPALEMHVTHLCDMKCQGCSHFCDLGYNAPLKADEAEEWMRMWSGRLLPEVFTLLGGEPLLQPDLPRFLRAAAKYFPKSQRKIVTNGLGLSRWAAELPQLLRETDTRLTLSIYGRQKQHHGRVRRALELIAAWKREYGLVTYYDTGDAVWRHNYQGSGLDILPYEHGNARKSYAACPKKNCTTIHQGKLWLCPHLAYLPLVADKLTHRAQWAEALSYTPLDSTASDEELEAFLSDFSHCGSCPVEPEFVINMETAGTLLPKHEYQDCLSRPDLAKIMAQWRLALENGQVAAFAFTSARCFGIFSENGHELLVRKVYDNNPTLWGTRKDSFDILNPKDIVSSGQKLIILVNDYAAVKQQLEALGLLEFYDFLPYTYFYPLYQWFVFQKLLAPYICFNCQTEEEAIKDIDIFFSQVDYVWQTKFVGQAAERGLEYIQSAYGRRFLSAEQAEGSGTAKGWGNQLQAIFGGLENLNAQEILLHFYQCLNQQRQAFFSDGRYFNCIHSQEKGDGLDFASIKPDGRFALLRHILGAATAPSFCSNCYGYDHRLQVRVFNE